MPEWIWVVAVWFAFCWFMTFLFHNPKTELPRGWSLREHVYPDDGWEARDETGRTCAAGASKGAVVREAWAAYGQRWWAESVDSEGEPK
jgi:hypothetical protein